MQAFLDAISDISSTPRFDPNILELKSFTVMEDVDAVNKLCGLMDAITDVHRKVFHQCIKDLLAVQVERSLLLLPIDARTSSGGSS